MLSHRETAARARQQINLQVRAFERTHQHFEQVADETTRFIRDHNLSLPQAYLLACQKHGLEATV